MEELKKFRLKAETTVQVIGFKESKKEGGKPWLCVLFTEELQNFNELISRDEVIISEQYFDPGFKLEANKLYPVVVVVPTFSDGFVIPQIIEFKAPFMKSGAIK